MPRTQDDYDRLYVSFMLRKARRLDDLLGLSANEVDEALRLLAIDASHIDEAQRHAHRLSSNSDMADAVHQFAGLRVLTERALGSNQGIRWAQDSLDLARKRSDPYTLAVAHGDLACALGQNGKADSAITHFVNAINGFLSIGNDDSRRQAGSLASMALGIAFESKRYDLLREWLELANYAPQLNEHVPCRVALMRARMQARENGREAALPDLRHAVELAARHGCPRCSGFANAMAGQLLIRRRSASMAFYHQSLIAYSEARLWESSAFVADVLLGLTILAPEILPDDAKSFREEHGVSEEDLFRQRCQEDPRRSHEVADFARRIGETRSALLTSGPASGRDRPHAALLAWVNANALWFAGRLVEAEAAFLEVTTEFDTELDPGKRHQTYFFLLRSIMVRSREDIKTGNIGTMFESYENASDLAQQGGYPEFIAEVEIEIASRCINMYLWAVQEGVAQELVQDAANRFTFSWGRLPPADCLSLELCTRRRELEEKARKAQLLPI
jgi:hypothetical protein